MIFLVLGKKSADFSSNRSLPVECDVLFYLKNDSLRRRFVGVLDFKLEVRPAEIFAFVEVDLRTVKTLHTPVGRKRAEQLYIGKSSRAAEFGKLLA